jgi:predicted PurR-regulated permease PerM
VTDDKGTDPRTREWSWAYAGLVLIAGALFLYSVRSVLGPVPVFLLLLLLLSPFAGTRTHGVAVTGITLLFAIWLLRTLGGLLTPFLLAAAVAYILDPAVDALERRGLHRWLAIAILALPAVAILAALLLIGVPAVAHQAETFLAELPTAAARLSTWLASVRTRLVGTDIPFIDEERVFGWIGSIDEVRIAQFLEERRGVLLDRSWSAVLGAGRGVGVVLALLGFLVLTPVLSVYLLRDWDRITAAAANLIPESRRARSVAFAREYDGLLARFLRGQVIAAAIVGVLTWLGLLIAGFPMSGLVGAIAGLFNLVPYLGLIASILPVVIIALLSGSILASLLKAGIVFAIVQFIDGSITGPRIVGESVGLHPVWVMLALAVGGFAFGFAGLILAMPAAVLIKLLLREAIARYRASNLFRSSET